MMPDFQSGKTIMIGNGGMMILSKPFYFPFAMAQKHRNPLLYNKETDTNYTQTIVLPVHGVLIAEGVFLQRAPLKNQFDKIIYLSVPECVRLNRVLQRDTYIGTAQQIIEKYENRYFPAERHYLTKHHPEQTADFLIQD